MGKDLKLVMGGCEDGVVRLFDYNSSKMTKKLQCQAGVSSVLSWDWQIAAGDHKGSLYFWDARTFKLI
jgi:WD40 repeat protein